MQLYFIRHGQSANNALFVSTGSDQGRSSDPPLTAIGCRQAEALANSLAGAYRAPDGHASDLQNIYGFGLTHLYCSLMERAVHTAVFIARRLDLPLHAWEDAHETGGIFLQDDMTDDRIGQAGHGRAYFADHFPELVFPASANPAGWWNRSFEYEEERQPRARRFVADLLVRHGNSDDRVAVVSHGGFYNHVMAEVLGLDEPGRVWFAINNTGLTRLDFHRSSVEVIYQNRLVHLTPDLVT